MTKFIAKTVELVFICLLAVILLAMSVSTAEFLFDGIVAFIVGVVILLLTIVGILLFKEKIKKIVSWVNVGLVKLSITKMMVILFAFSAVTKVFFVFLFDNNADLHPDMAMYRSYAIQHAKEGFITENTKYALNHNYTLVFGILLSPLAKMFGDDTKVFTTVLSILHSVSLVLIFDMLKKYVDSKIVFLVLMTYSLLPFGMFQTQLLIHENGLLFFHILAFWLFLKALDEKKPFWFQIICLLCASTSIALGKSVNAAGRVIFISLAIFAVAKIAENGLNFKKASKILMFFWALAVFYIGASGVTKTVVQNKVEGADEYVTDSYKLPYGWSLYVGLNYESKGTWTEEDRNTYCKYEKMGSVEEAVDYQKDLLKGRLKEYTFIKAISHVFNKIKSLFGVQLLPFAYDQGNEISSFVGRGILGKLLRIINAISFLTLYSMILISRIKELKKIKCNKVHPDIHCKMVIIGVTLALLLFEVMPKYASHLHILFFMILAISVKELFKSENDICELDNALVDGVNHEKTNKE